MSIPFPATQKHDDAVTSSGWTSKSGTPQFTPRLASHVVMMSCANADSLTSALLAASHSRVPANRFACSAFAPDSQALFSSDHSPTPDFQLPRWYIQLVCGALRPTAVPVVNRLSCGSMSARVNAPKVRRDRGTLSIRFRQIAPKIPALRCGCAG